DDRGAYLDILSADPRNAQAFENLGSTLLPGESLRLPDGLLVSKQSLHAKAAELDESHSSAHNSLGAMLDTDEVCNLKGREMNQRALFARAVELDPGNAVAH
ncbi:ltaA, partial [Symbiodinium sp. KB8]